MAGRCYLSETHRTTPGDLMDAPGRARHTAGMSLAGFLCGKAWGAIDRVLDACWEKRLGICTTGHAEVNYPDARPYHSLHYRLYWRVLRHCRPAESDVIVDVGCGKGRVLCCAATFPARQVIGVEIDPALCAAARENAARMRGRRCPISVENTAAQEFDYTPATILVMFNPFGRDTMAAVIGRVGRSLADRPRRLRVVYGNPVDDDLLAAAPWLRRVEHWPACPWTGRKFAVSFWEAHAPAG